MCQELSAVAKVSSSLAGGAKLCKLRPGRSCLVGRRNGCARCHVKGMMHEVHLGFDMSTSRDMKHKQYDSVASLR